MDLDGHLLSISPCILKHTLLPMRRRLKDTGPVGKLIQGKKWKKLQLEVGHCTALLSKIDTLNVKSTTVYLDVLESNNGTILLCATLES